MAKKTEPEIFVSKDHPFGVHDSVEKFRVGDYVALIYSDHEEYIFDNPEGVITDIDDDDDIVTVTVVIEASIDIDRVLLMARPKPGQIIMPDGEIKLAGKKRRVTIIPDPADPA